MRWRTVGIFMENISERSKVSIIIPTHNSGETLGECFESIHCQSYPYYEVILVDNFSRDNTLRIAEEFGAKIVQKKGTPALARNVGVLKSTGKYVLFLDSDQVLPPLVVEECAKKCSNGRVGMVKIFDAFVGRNFWGSCSAVWKNHYSRVGQLHGSSGDLAQGEPRFFLKAHLIKVGLLDATLLWGEDYDLYERLKKNGVKEAVSAYTICHYEHTSVRQILLKNLRYGESMPTFVQQTKRKILLPLLKNAMLTFKEVLRDAQSIALVVGCAVLLFLKANSMLIGILSNALNSTATTGKQSERTSGHQKA